MPSERPKRGSELPTPEQMGLDEREIAWRKAFLRLRDDDARRLAAASPAMEAHANAFIEALYQHLLSDEKTRAFFRDPRTLGHAAAKQHEYFLQLAGGEYGREYVRSRLLIGFVHERIGVPLKAYFGAYEFYLEALARTSLAPAAAPGGEGASAGSAAPPTEAFETFLSMLKLVFFDISLAIEAHVFQREQTIRAQQDMIRELSTPVLRVRDRLLIVPLIGALDSARMRQLSEQLLAAIPKHRARAVVVDVTGVAVVDSAVANELIKTVQSARLMGAGVIVTGISTEIAQTLVRIGVDLSQLETMNDLQAGIAAAEEMVARALREKPGAARSAGPGARGDGDDGEPGPG